MNNTIKDKDLVLISTPKRRYITRVEKGKSFFTKQGVLKFNDIIGQEFGTKVDTHYVLKPSLNDFILYGLKRETQIIYPKESGQIILKLDLANGMKVFECGTGSGALSLFLARAIEPDGVLFTYEKEKVFYQNAKMNIENAGSGKNIKFFNHDIEKGIDEKDFDAAFVDLKEPHKYIEWLRTILKKGSVLGMLVPTTNQVSAILKKCEKHFFDIQIIEVLMREYIPNPTRLRPKDIMVGHTGYLVFAR
ncbi:MAG: tRNA (adenine-N1)-methyltransferase [Spirochaetes bacterium]|nr:tRNA (adenine-N1)-methyltransferase [Spirochaetota bacterium]